MSHGNRTPFASAGAAGRGVVSLTSSTLLTITLLLTIGSLPLPALNQRPRG
jgi:hypothetical protein